MFKDFIDHFKETIIFLLSLAIVPLFLILGLTGLLKKYK